MDMGIARMDYLKCLGTLGMNLHHLKHEFTATLLEFTAVNSPMAKNG